MGSVSIPESSNVVLQGSLVLEIRSACAEPELATVLLMGSPVAAHCKCLAALAAHERLDPVLPLVMSLQGTKVFQRLGAGVVDVVAAAWCAAVARQPQHGGGLGSS